MIQMNKENIKEDLEQKILKTLDIDDNYIKGAELAKNLIASIGNPLNVSRYMLEIGIKKDMPDATELFEWIKTIKLTGDVKKYAEDGKKALLAMPREDVSITSLDGLKLTGHIVRAEKQERVIIAVHGWRSNWLNDFGGISTFWNNTNNTVLYIDQRAQGDSEGEYMSFGVFERFDVFEWAKWASNYFGKDTPIFLAGVSMGASSVLMAAAERYPENIKGIVADCGFTGPNEIWEHVAKNCLHLPYPEAAIKKHCVDILHFDSSKHSTKNALEKSKLPILFIHGIDDSFVPMEMSLENYDACNSEKELMLVKGADHGLSHFTDTARYEEKMTEFFKKHE